MQLENLLHTYSGGIHQTDDSRPQQPPPPLATASKSLLDDRFYEFATNIPA
jgi:hypothetical protein